MIGRIVITSVPKGLDGGTGFQPVLRTQGLRPSIAERLAIRAAYPHPFPFGDPRNPHVLFHRIETVGDRTIHVLGSVRDAGSSYTGRANHLSELIAIDSAETRGLPAGPAFAARAFPWLARWAGAPREVPFDAEQAIPAHDSGDPEATGRPARCTAWEKATGDAGWAGELAQSFLDGRRALIWAGGDVDVLELFVEAARLIPASARWQLTFNTCEIEPFPAHWRAVRPELGLVGNYEPKNELRLVLGKLHESRSRAPDHDLVKIARGETPAPRTAPPPRAPQTPQPVSGPGGAPTSPSTSTATPTAPDDTALRARLKEISDDRRRRSGAGRVPHGASHHEGRGSLFVTTLLLGGLALVGAAATVMAVMTIQHPDAITRWLGGHGDEDAIDSSEVDLRTEQQQQEKTAAKDAAEKRAKEEAAAGREAQARIARDDQAHQDRLAAQHEKERLETEKAAANTAAREAQHRQEKLAAQQKAFMALAAKPELTVHLLNADAPASLDVTASKPTEVLLCDAFDIEHLIDPTLEFASPYTDEGRLVVADDTASLDNTRTWLVTGTTYNATEEKWQTDPVCRIIARERQLLLQPQVEASHTLFGSLQNSLLLVSSRDPDSQDGPLVQRCRIGLAKPIEVPSPYLLDPLAEDDRLKVDIDKAMTRRLAGIAPELLEWSIALSHPALGEPAIVNHNVRCADLQLAEPPSGTITVTYHGIDDDGSIRARVVPLKLDAKVCFWPAEKDKVADPAFVVTRDFLGLDDSSHVLKNKITIESLRRARNAGDEKAWGRLTPMLMKPLLGQKDPARDALERELRELERQFREIPAPGSNARPGITPENRAAYIADQKHVQSLIGSTLEALRAHDSERKKEAAEDAANAVAALTKHADCFQPIAARVQTLEAIAEDSKGKKYRIPIVKPAAD